MCVREGESVRGPTCTTTARVRCAARHASVADDRWTGLAPCELEFPSSIVAEGMPSAAGVPDTWFGAAGETYAFGYRKDERGRERASERPLAVERQRDGARERSRGLHRPKVK